MFKMSNWSLAGMTLGFLFALFSSIRYFILYPDTDRAIVYIIIGCLIMAVSFLYNKIISLGNTLTAVEDFLADKT